MTARDRFNETRKAVVELETVRAMIATQGEEWRPEGVHVGGIGSPTESRAIYNVDVWADKLIELVRRERELDRFVSVSVQLIDAIRAGLGEPYADIMYQRYITGLPWSQVFVGAHKVAISTGKRRVAVACDWVDSVGITRLLEGDYEV